MLDQDDAEPLWKKFLEQFKDPLIGLLFASAFVSVMVKQVLFFENTRQAVSLFNATF